MNRFSLLVDLGIFLLSAGLFLAVNSLMITFAEVFLSVWRKLFKTWARRRLMEMGIVREKSTRAPIELDFKRIALYVGVTSLALAVKDAMLSPLVILVGLVILWWIDFQGRQTEQAQVNEDAELVALQIRSLLTSDHSISNALSKIDLPNGIMKQNIERIANRLKMHQAPEQAAISLKGLPGNVTARLAALIAHNARLTDDVQDSLLSSLEHEAHRQKLIRSKMRQSLSLVRGTIRLLQGVVAGTVLFVFLSPVWREFFLQDISHRVLLATLVCGSVLASLYFEFEVYQLGRGEVF